MRRCAAALRFGDQGDNLRQHGIGANARGADHQCALAIQGSAGDRIACRFRDRNGLAGDHGFVDGAFAFDHSAVDRNGIAGAHQQLVAQFDIG